MVQLGLDAKGLTTLGKMLHLPLSQTDTGYLMHCALGELFGDDAPKPFSIEIGRAQRLNSSHITRSRMPSSA